MRNYLTRTTTVGIALLLAGMLGVWFFYGHKHSSWPYREPAPEQALVLDWYQHALVCDRYAEGYNGPIAARTYAYLGLAAYETALSALDGYLSMAGHYPDLYLPVWEHPEYPLHLPSALNACYAFLFDHFFVTVPPQVQEAGHQLKKKWEQIAAGQVPQAQHRASARFGREVAAAVHQWSAKDSLGHQAFFHNFERSYVPPVQAGKWEPSKLFPMPALLPYWGQVRTFLVSPQDLAVRPLPEFSMDAGSPYYIQALELYTVSSPLSFENKWIAEFWSDDHHGLTFSPSGRWISIANQVVAQEQPHTDKLLETYLRLGLVMHDAFVYCWHAKYHYNQARPETLIQKIFNPQWTPLGHTPPFPAYPSGHATIAAASAVVLTKLYGDGYALTDESHRGRTEFKGEPRHFHSFQEMAYENAYSRIPLGVHLRMDCDEGFRLGGLLGKAHNQLHLQTHSFSGK